MILVIGERGNCPQLTNKEVLIESRNWNWLRALKTKWGGGSLNRLDKLLTVSYEVVNMLPPSNVCGAWDRNLAKGLAPQILSYFKQQTKYSTIILLGRRVIDTLFPGTPFEEIKKIGNLNILCIHHPSGRSGFWSKSNMQKVKNWINFSLIL